MDIANAAFWIDYLKLEPHPEGGYYKEIFRSGIEVVKPSTSKTYQACTSIYYLLEGKDYSGFHRLSSDEIWYFHKGVPLLIHVIDEEGNYTVLELSDSWNGSLSIVIRAGLWFAAEIPGKAGFALVSCAVAPAFEFSEFEMAQKKEMQLLYPQHTEILEKLCRE